MSPFFSCALCATPSARSLIDPANLLLFLFLFLLSETAHLQSFAIRVPDERNHVSEQTVRESVYLDTDSQIGVPLRKLLPMSAATMNNMMITGSRVYLTTRTLLGSAPPKCAQSCRGCKPCTRVLIPIHVPSVASEYYPLAWRCQCREKTLQPIIYFWLQKDS